MKELQPNGMYLCSYMGAIPPKMGKVDNSWFLDCHGKIAKGLRESPGEMPYMWHTLGAPGWMEWMRLYEPHGALGPDSFGGWWVGWEMPHEKVFEYSREKDLYCGCTIDDHAVLNGDWDTIEAQLAPRLQEAKRYPKHFCAIGVLDYWTPQPYFDKVLEMAKTIGKF